MVYVKQTVIIAKFTMASGSSRIDDLEDVESDSAGMPKVATDNTLLLPVAGIEQPAEGKEKMPDTAEEPMSVNEKALDLLNPESDGVLESSKSKVENKREPEIDNSIPKKSEATSMTSSKEDTGSSVEKLDSTKQTETDLDSSIEVISSPVTEEERKYYFSDESDTPAATEAVDNVDSAKAIDVDLDSSIEVIDSPGESAMSSKDTSQEDNLRHRVDSDSSVELISSPGKDTNAESSVKDSPTENTEGKSEIKEDEKEGLESEKEDGLEPITNDDVAGGITEESKDPEISIDTEQAKHEPNIEETASTSAQSETDTETKEEEKPTPSEKLDESKTLTESEQKDESMEAEDTTNECKEENTKLKKEEALEAIISENEEHVDELGEDNEIYYKKDCINCNCKKLHTQYVCASVAVLNYYKVSRKARKRQYICLDCYDAAMDVYEVSKALDEPTLTEANRTIIDSFRNMPVIWWPNSLCSCVNSSKIMQTLLPWTAAMKKRRRMSRVG